MVCLCEKYQFATNQHSIRSTPSRNVKKEKHEFELQNYSAAGISDYLWANQEQWVV